MKSNLGYLKKNYLQPGLRVGSLPPTILWISEPARLPLALLVFIPCAPGTSQSLWSLSKAGSVPGGAVISLSSSTAPLWAGQLRDEIHDLQSSGATRTEPTAAPLPATNWEQWENLPLQGLPVPLLGSVTGCPQSHTRVSCELPSKPTEQENFSRS